MEIPLRVILRTRDTAIQTEGCASNNYKVGATLFRKKKIYKSYGNCNKSHPKLIKISKFPILHAEQRTIFSYGIDNCEGMSLCVVRIKRNGDLTMAKPCNSCQFIIEMAKIYEVWYSNWDGEMDHYYV